MKVAHLNEARVSRLRDIDGLIKSLQRERADIVRLIINQMDPDGELYSHTGRVIATYRQGTFSLR